jgi:hypothetical protein
MIPSKSWQCTTLPMLLLACASSLMAQGNVPVIASLEPASREAGAGAFDLVVNGSNFRDGAAVYWNGQPRATERSSATRLSARILASDVAQPGSATVTVRQRVGQQERQSNARDFAITPAVAPENPIPTVTGLLPSTLTVGRPGQSLLVNGSNFVAGAVVHWNGSPRRTEVLRPTQLRAELTADDLAAPATVQISAVNPSPGGGTSAPRTLQVVHPTPTITSLSPATATQGGATYTLTVDGTGFLQSGTNTVLWKNQPRDTRFVSATRLTATIPASDLTTVGDAAVTVRTQASASVRTSAPVNTTVLASASPVLIVANPTPLSISRFHVGGSGNPARIALNQSVELYTVHSGFPAPTHWKSSRDDGRAFRTAQWQPMSTPPRHTFTSTGDYVWLFQYRRVIGSDTTYSNVARDSVTVRRPFSSVSLPPAMHLGDRLGTHQRLECANGRIMNGIRISRDPNTAQITGIGLVCDDVNQAMIGTTSGGTQRIACSAGEVPGYWGRNVSAADFSCEENVFGSLRFNPLYAVPAAGVGSPLWAGCEAGLSFLPEYRVSPVGLDVWRDATGVKGLGFLCAKPD